MRHLILTALLVIAITAFGATAASAGCCAPKCKQHTCTKLCAPKCEPCKVDCCKPKCEPCKPKCEPCKPMPKLKLEPKVMPCFCCPFAYTLKPFGYDVPCAMPPMDFHGMPPMGHPELMPMDHHRMPHHGVHGMPPMMDEPQQTDAESE